ncbi:Uncharacterized conserved protein, DUF305 family [Parafrankia irregularis]|uniref:Uncharacterized conserved protein, DUF305 family n=1 Tax=Parafrankia irregularis TaxID=795642 RepID=A0A0S4QR45_9ACTN|nr:MULTISPECIES: DUF305 domain-containing protein [Parafrankia]MBE3202765.1 DUF305 domain-containing protein [Parafrankia sp. CH37]CUU57955.1 Uncharacterized conserved protein, DUF305 family [Parafrankia irregularis]
MRRRHHLGLAAAGLALAATLVACGSGDAPAPSSSTTAGSGSAVSAGDHNAADVMFAQMMIPHHQQAVEMAELAPGRATDPAVLTLAQQIGTAQAPEIATMTGWLDAWGEPTAMPGGGHGGGGHGTEGMGMMSESDMAALRGASGPAFDRMFCEMMIRHHEGAIEMARTEQRDGRFPDAVALAGTIVSTQTAEVATMKGLLGTG